MESGDDGAGYLSRLACTIAYLLVDLRHILIGYKVLEVKELLIYLQVSSN